MTNAYATEHGDSAPAKHSKTDYFSVISVKRALLANHHYVSVYAGDELINAIEIADPDEKHLQPAGFWNAEGSTYWLSTRTKDSEHWELNAYDPDTLAVRHRHDLGSRRSMGGYLSFNFQRLSEDEKRIYVSVYHTDSHWLRILDASNLELVSEVKIRANHIDVEDLQDEHIALFTSTAAGNRILHVIDRRNGETKHWQRIPSREDVSVVRTEDRRYVSLVELLDREAAGMKRKNQVTVVRFDGNVTSRTILGNSVKRVRSPGGVQWFVADNDQHSSVWKLQADGVLKQVAVTPEPCRNVDAAVHANGVELAIFCRKKLWYFNGETWSGVSFKAQVDDAILGDGALFAMQRKGKSIFRFDLAPLGQSHEFTTAGLGKRVLLSWLSPSPLFLASMYHDEERDKLYLLDTKTSTIAVVNSTSFLPIEKFRIGGRILGVTRLRDSPFLFVRSSHGLAGINVETGKLSFDSQAGELVGLDPRNNRVFLKSRTGVELVSLDSGLTQSITHKHEILAVDSPAWGTRAIKIVEFPHQFYIY